MGVIEKILEEIEEGAHAFEILGRDVDFVAIDWVRDVIRKRLNDAEYPYITEKDIEAVPPASEEFLAECREVAKKYGKNDGWIPVEERLPEEKVNPVTTDYYEYQVTARFGSGDIDVRHYKFGKGHWWHGPGIVDNYVIAWRENPEPYRPERSE